MKSHMTGRHGEAMTAAGCGGGADSSCIHRARLKTDFDYILRFPSGSEWARGSKFSPFSPNNPNFQPGVSGGSWLVSAGPSRFAAEVEHTLLEGFRSGAAAADSHVCPEIILVQAGNRSGAADVRECLEILLFQAGSSHHTEWGLSAV